MTAAADLGVGDAAAALAGRTLSSRELVDACLARIRERDGTHSHDGDPGSVNAWVRVYEEDARAAAARADERLARGDAPPLCGIPVGLKDLYAVAGKPLTASSRVLDEVPDRDCDAWARLSAAGMVLLGHVHTHEFAAGGTTDQVGNPWALDRSPGGSSGGSAAALASRTVPAATGTDTAGSLRIPSAVCGTSTIKPTRGLVPMRGIVPLSPSLDHAGPMARTVHDCEPLLAALAGAAPPTERRPLRRIAVSPRIADLDPDVADGFDTALETLGARRVAAPPPSALGLGTDFIDVVCLEMLVYHRRFDDQRALYRPSIRGFLEHAERRAMTGEEYVSAQTRRAETTHLWADWLAEHRIDAIVEPTVPLVARPRGHGYDEPFTDLAEISLTHYWDWVGFPVVALPSGVGQRSGLPVSVSLIGAPGADWDLLAAGAALQDELGHGGAVIDVAAVTAIDVHVHTERSRAGHDPLPPALRAAAERYFHGAGLLPTVDDVAAHYRERGLAAVVFTVDWESQSGVPPIPNEEIADGAAANADVLIPFASVDPARPGAVEIARRLIADHGVKGFKFHPTLQAFFPDDRSVYPLYEAIAEAGLPALFHTGHSGIGTGLPGGGGLRLKYSNPLCLDDVAADFPELPIVLAHPSFPWQDEAISICLHKENVWIDLSGWSPKYFPPQLVQYANTQLREKVLFGSDFPLLTPDRWLADFEQAPFRDEVRPLILKQNAARLLGL